MWTWFEKDRQKAIDAEAAMATCEYWDLWAGGRMERQKNPKIDPFMTPENEVARNWRKVQPNTVFRYKGVPSWGVRDWEIVHI